MSYQALGAVPQRGERDPPSSQRFLLFDSGGGLTTSTTKLAELYSSLSQKKAFHATSLLVLSNQVNIFMGVKPLVLRN